jgi:DNA-binding transcriptional ArsR family regulator
LTVLRIHFTAEDVARVRMAGCPDPLWETVFSLFRLRQRDAPLIFGEWRRQAVRRIRRTDLDLLLPLVPGGYYPDFLTPAEGALGLDAGIEALLATPRQRLRGDLEILAAEQGPLRSWMQLLGAGDPQTLEQLGGAIRSHYRAVVAPYWHQVQAHVDADRAKRAKAFLEGGCEGLLRSYLPMMRWEPPVLVVDVPFEQTLHLDGRGLVLVPSFLSWNTPDVLKDTTLPPVLVYPIEHDLALSARTRPPGASLGALIGATRAAVLEAVEGGRTTSEVARRVGVSAGAISQHTSVLREAGLIRTSRAGKAVVHTLTPLGSALLEQGAPGALVRA